MSESLLANPHDEARARIIWGDSPAEVQHWLVMEGGLTEEQAEVIVRDIRKERAYEIRRSGLRSVRTGSLLLLGATALWIAIYFLYVIPRILPLAAIALTVYGLYKIVSGVLRFLSGRATGSLTEMD